MSECNEGGGTNGALPYTPQDDPDSNPRPSRLSKAVIVSSDSKEGSNWGKIGEEKIKVAFCTQNEQ